jgi:hypothetical protein
MYDTKKKGLLKAITNIVGERCRLSLKPLLKQLEQILDLRSVRTPSH